MPKPRLSTEDVQRTLDAIAAHPTQTAAALTLGISTGSLSQRLKMIEQRKPFEAEELPSELPTAEQLIERRRQQFTKKKDASEARHLIPVKVTIDGPIGLTLMGDPHLDDNGTDIALIERHLDVINRTEALFGGCIGDYSNNWVGRLARLYGQQSTSAAEAWVLVEWFIGAAEWLFLVGGNHDLWSGDGDPIQWMAKSARVSYEAHGARLGLQLPSGRTIRLNARHDFSGRSQWNVAHGPAKAAQMGWRDHVLVCGHTHVSGHQVLRDPASGLISHALRVGSYKTFDRYADEKGLPNQTFMVAPTVVIRPQFADDDNRLITVCYDPETGADFLKFIRRRKSERTA